MEKVANRYAEALFEFACEEHKVNDWQNQMGLIKQALAQDEKTQMFFASKRVSSEDKKALLDQAFKSSIDTYIMNFIFLLVDKSRISQFDLIARKFHRLCNGYKGIKEGFVYSIRELSDEEIKQIETSVSKKLDTNVELTNRISKDLISGIRVVVEDVVIDGSMKYKLDNLRSELLKGSR